jgi:hypothetical protein
MVAQEPSSAASGARFRWVEALALALLAALPVVPYLAVILRTGVPRFTLFGDFALLEQATRHAWHLDTFLGPYSRFHWHHPGPLFFYVVAPFSAAFGTTSTGLYVGTCLVNAASAAAMVVSTRIFVTRAHALAVLAVVLAWFAAFGNVTANPWNPLVIVLPMMAYLLHVALFARGDVKAAFPTVFFAALVTQMHIAVTTTVAVTFAVAIAAYAIDARRRFKTEPSATKHELRLLALAAAFLVFLFLPPLYEQITAPGSGNLSRILHFFLHRTEPQKPLMTALRQWVVATSWMPERVWTRTLADESYIPLVMRWDSVTTEISRSALYIVLGHVVLTAGAAFAAWRTRDRVSLALLAMGTLANIVAISALRSIVGESYHYLVFWATAGSAIAWAGIVSVAFAAVSRLRVSAPQARIITAGIVALACVCAIESTSLQHRWFEKYGVAPASRPRERDDLHAIYTALRARLGTEHTPVIYAEGAWDMAYATVLELEKDGLDVRVPEHNVWIYAGVRGPEGAKNPLHVWFSTTPLTLPFPGCLDFLAKSGDITAYTAATGRPCDGR